MDHTITAAIITGSATIIAGVITVIYKLIRDNQVAAAYDNKALAMSPKTIELIKVLIPDAKRKELRLKREMHLLSRLGKRHILFRQETICQIMKAIIPSQIEQLGISIGESAADDLLESITSNIEKKIFKTIKNETELSPSDFFSVFNHWDQTGGWGKFEFKMVDKTNWEVIVSNNFLSHCSNEHSSVFWKGYFKGFVENILKILVKKDHGFKKFPLNPKPLENIVCLQDGETIKCSLFFERS